MSGPALDARVLAVLKEVLAAHAPPVSLHEPRFSGRELEYISDCVTSGWVSSVGAYVDRFERELAAYTGARHAVATANGTAALHLCLLLSGVEPGDEVLVPALSFVATANAVRYCHAEPHFVEVEDLSLGVDAVALRAYLGDIAERRDGQIYNRATGRRIRALVPMHAFGHPVDLDALLALASDFGLALVEDAAESLGSYYHGRHTGTLAPLGALSFNGNKLLTTGGGGAILTNDSELARRAKHLSTTAKQPHRWAFVHDEVGYNYRLPNLNAALGCAQLERIDTLVAAKRRLAEQYARAFEGIAGIRFLREPAYARSNYWLNAILLGSARERDAVLEATNGAGYMTRPVWTLLCDLPMYQASPRMELPVARRIEAGLVNIPSSPHLAAEAA